MSSSKKVRVNRGPPPSKPIKRTRYKNALPDLLRDFENRCAYSMQHTECAGMLEVDHFDPRLKGELFQDYNNLFPASRHCNCRKSDNWPSKTEMAAGCRFLNPCTEIDYGEQIYEDHSTGMLIGVTPAAKWHIRICGLNAGHLVNERVKRTNHWKSYRNTQVKIKRCEPEVGDIIAKFKSQVELMIPEIPALPSNGG